ncbi:MAG: DUF5723 family protein [Prevotellaceae bacterium]|jgi:hypothetical protein|nr:DUF5723 family protein [Prevotellaceae bacterium]
MKTNYRRYAHTIIIAMIALSAAITTVPAQVNTLYYMKTVSTRHELNPSFQPLPNGYYSTIPVVSGFYVGAGNNSLSLDNVLYPKMINGEYKTIWFYHNEGNIDDFYNSLKKTTRLYAEADLRLFAFGIRMPHNSYLTVGLNTKMNTGIFIPKDLIKFFTYGTPDPENGNSFDLSNLGVRSNVYTELATGYSRVIDEKLTVGGKFKLLMGHTNTIMKFNRFTLNASKDKWDFDIKGTINMSGPFKYEMDDQEKINGLKFSPTDYLCGFGAAIDLGANYKLFDDKLNVSAALLDLGFINWKAKNSANMPIEGSFDFDGIDINIKDGDANWDEGYFDNVMDNIEYSTTYKPYASALATKVLIGAEYSIMDNQLTFGGLSKSTIINKSVFQEITASANYLPFDFLNLSLSYSLLNGRFGTIGLGIGGRMGPVNIFIASDYFPAKYTKQFVPYKNKSINVQYGFLFNFGYSAKKNADDDKDGVQNRYDKCPDTPADVLVNQYGCPVENVAKQDL